MTYDILTLFFALLALCLFVWRLSRKWRGSYVQIIAGTGMGQIRRISKTEADRLILGAPFTIPPDNTSEFAERR